YSRRLQTRMIHVHMPGVGGGAFQIVRDRHYGEQVTSRVRSNVSQTRSNVNMVIGRPASS
ncbi:MAG TPA: hypothetical protein VFC21_05270, partial [Bryobacteraceae bacterium]|nr:hypothetical protein [Bryobacteraceae bacterium]